MKYEVEFHDERHAFRTLIVEARETRLIPFAITALGATILKINKYRTITNDTKGVWTVWN